MKFLAVMTLALLASLSSNRLQAQTPYYNSFKTNTLNGITLGEDAKLTAGIEDPAGDGYLRLTSNMQNKKGYAYINQAFPSDQGIRVEFEFFTWGGTIADGITFFLFDPVDGFEIGQYGGALGYAQNNNNGTGLGMKNGFLAVALDEYGNFGPATETKSGGFRTANNQTYSSVIYANGLVVVRGGVGPNKEREGPLAYPFLGGKITNPVFGNGTPTPHPDDLLPVADQFPIYTSGRGPNETDDKYRKVRLDIKRVAGTGFTINLDVFVGALGRWVNVLQNFTYTIDNSRVPSQLKAGFSASTGGQYNYHEIRNVLITPSAANLASPVASNDVTLTLLNQAKTISILGNDNAAVNTSGVFQTGSVDLNPATAVIESTLNVAGKGVFNVDGAGTVTFTPQNGFLGTATASYTFKDNFGILSNTATITVNVNLQSAAPTVSGINKSGPEDTPILFTAADFSTKFSDPESDALNMVRIGSLPANGTLQLNNVAVTLNQDITFGQLSNLTFVPAQNWNGTTSFAWNGSDGLNYAAANATVTITITPVNDIPVVAAINKTGTEDIPVNFTSADFTSKFTDPDNQAVAEIRIVSLPLNGLLKLNGANISVNQQIPAAQLGNISFVPDVNWSGNTSFLWNGSDGSSFAAADASVTITISPANDLPVVSAITKTGTEDVAVPFTSIDFTSKFSDPENDVLTRIKFTSLPPNGTLQLSGVAVTLNQEILVAQLANLSFVPATNFNGNTSFNWNGFDGSSYAAADASVTISITGVNDLPTVAPISKTGAEDSPVLFATNDFSSKFSDPDNDALSKVKITSLPLNGLLKLNGVDVVSGQEITSVQLSNLTFHPNANWNGSTSFTWNGNDGTSFAVSDATVSITVTPVNDVPLVSAISKNGVEDTPVPFNQADFTSKFSDIENEALSKIKFTILPANGTLKLNNSSISLNQEIPVGQVDNIVFVPNTNWNGLASFKWNGSDGSAYASLDADVTISIVSVVDPPIAMDDAKETDLNKAIEIIVMVNDLADGIGLDNSSVLIVSPPLNGQVVIKADGTVTYTPRTKYAGPDSFTYKIKDANGNWSNTATVSVVVNGLVMSNVFTPNGDGKNDTFEIVGFQNYDNVELTVFNRWGNEVYRNATYTNSWDGFGLNPGTYYFIAKLRKGAKEDIRKGWVLLKR